MTISANQLPPLTDPVSLSIRLEPKQMQTIKEIAAKTHASQSAVMRMVFRAGLRDMPPYDSDEWELWFDSLGSPF